MLERGKRREQSKVTSKNISGGVKRIIVQTTAIFWIKKGEKTGETIRCQTSLSFTTTMIKDMLLKSVHFILLIERHELPWVFVHVFPVPAAHFGRQSVPATRSLVD